MAWFRRPAPVACTSSFTSALAFALSALTTVFRDVTHLTEMALLLLFWATPIVYPAEMAPAALQVWFRLSPFRGLREAYQALLVRHRLPDAGALAHARGLDGRPPSSSGTRSFGRLSPTFAEAV